jgi:hypothetical protein
MEIRDHPQPTGARTAIKRLLLKRPDLTIEQIEQALKRQGYDPTPTRLAIQSIRTDFRATLKLLHAEGWIDLDLNTFYRERRSRRTS